MLHPRNPYKLDSKIGDMLNNINQPTEPKVNRLIAYCSSVGVPLIATGASIEMHLIIWIGIIFVTFPLIAVFLPSK